MPGTIMIFLLYVFALIGFFSFTFLSIFNLFLLMLNMLHYLRKKKIRESENPLKHKVPPLIEKPKRLHSCGISRKIVNLHDQSLFIHQRINF